jgi:DNA (cytosine-5)-methyltransferase 1
MKFIDLFGGIGGFRLGIEKAKPDWKCVWYCDIDKYAVEIYNSRFGEKYEARDIREVDEREIPRHDLLCAGFPCQSFSVAGRRKGFEDRRGNLFFEICRVARAKRPKILFLENVKGLLSHERGKTFAVILDSLQELGYWIEWQVLNSKDFGVPQNRERVFIVGHLGKEGGQQVFPLGEGDKRDNGTRQKAQGKEARIQNANTLSSRYYKGGEQLIKYFHKADREYARIYETSGISPTLHRKTGGWQEAKIIIHNMQPRSSDRPSLKYSSGGSGHLTRTDNMTYCLDCRNTNAIEIKTISNTLTEALGTRQGSSSEFIRSVEKIAEATGRIRRLTPVECERLQGFPDGWTEGVSDTQRYKMLGNAVTVNVIEAIAKEVKNET